MEDSAWPFPAGQQPPADCVLVYGPGDTPHTWTPGDINEQRARYRMPGFVRSDPQNASYVQDCNAFVAWLKAVGCPKGSSVFLDLETAVAAGYVSAFGYIMNLEGYNVLPYGSIGYVWQNPPLDGLFVSHPGQPPHICTPGRCGNGLNADARITQYQFDGSYDMSLIDPSVPLWDTQASVEEPVTQQDIQNIVAALEPVVQKIVAAQLVPVLGGIGLLEYGDSENAAFGKGVQGHPWNLKQIWDEIGAIKAAVAKIPTSVEPVSLKGQSATITFS